MRGLHACRLFMQYQLGICTGTAVQDLINSTSRYTFTEIGFGRKLGNLASPDAHPFELAFDEAHRISGYRFTTPAWLWKLKRWLNVGSERRLRDSVVVINEFLMDTSVGTMERRQHESVEAGGPTAKLDIVSIILDTMEVSGQIITPDDIRVIVFAGVIAGRDTTADALSWLMHALHNNPRVVKNLRKEILENCRNSQSLKVTSHRWMR
ncbi:hypothetical protein PI124_g22912 [Phytophthora idaei]|nr:hypothetical protein PI125_g24875 [Phytophthora idaei]KAG3125233.1 hypothetical protein PI126_g22867 [Phytophthora idaei]KAG3231998.1 hypothetical protein PI124_g22912 [Phytophthora idaei]